MLGNTSAPTGGDNTNCIIAGHRGWKGADYFRHIDKLTVGDEVVITAPMLCAEYPFIRNIPQERVVDDRGSLFCVVPRDPDATVVVNRIRWSEVKGDYETIKELYRSQSGEPILLFVSYDLEKTPFETTELRLTDRYGDTLS